MILYRMTRNYCKNFKIGIPKIIIVTVLKMEQFGVENAVMYPKMLME